MRWLCYFVSVAVSVVALKLPAQQTTPFEERLHAIYQTHYAEPISPGEWIRILGARKNEEYVIQPGDTLWDISLMFFGDGFYWPKLWALNDRIENPHLIEPGYAIRFYVGSFDAPPGMNVAVDEDSPQTYLSRDSIILPPPSVFSPPVLRSIPPSLPNTSDNARERLQSIGKALGVHAVRAFPSRLFLNTFISTKPIEAAGEIIDSEDHFGIVNTYQYVFVQLEKGRGQVGDYYRSVRPGTIFGKEYSLSVGTPYMFGGDMKLVEKVNDYRNVFKALVENTVGPVMIEDSIEPGRIPHASFVETGTPGGETADGQIAGAVYSGDRKIIGEHSVVFLNRGSQDGVEKGMLFSIFANERKRLAHPYITDYRRHLGNLKVVDARSKVSTAIITDMIDSIVVGDFIGPYQKRPKAMKVVRELTPEELSREADDLDVADEFDRTFDSSL